LILPDAKLLNLLLAHNDGRVRRPVRGSFADSKLCRDLAQ
jgi:hypothetical protein